MTTTKQEDMPVCFKCGTSEHMEGGVLGFHCTSCGYVTLDKDDRQLQHEIEHLHKNVMVSLSKFQLAMTKANTAAIMFERTIGQLKEAIEKVDRGDK